MRERPEAFKGFFGPVAELELLEGTKLFFVKFGGLTYTEIQWPEGPHRA